MSTPAAARETWTWSAATGAAARDLLPSLVALVPFALVVGVTAQQTGVGALGGLVGGFALFAGTAQLSAMTLLDGGAPVVTVVLSVAVINARLPLYAAALERHFHGQPGWFRWLGPHFIVDQTFAIATTRGDLADPLRFRRYWLATAALLSVVWLTTIAVGMRVGLRLPASSPLLAFAPVAVFVPMLVPRLTDRTSVTVAAVAAATTVATHLSGLVPPGMPVLAGAVAGTLAGAVHGRSTS